MSKRSKQEKRKASTDRRVSFANVDSIKIFNESPADSSNSPENKQANISPLKLDDENVSSPLAAKQQSLYDRESHQSLESEAVKGREHINNQVQQQRTVEGDVFDMEMTECVGDILDEITREPCNEMELTTCVGNILADATYCQIDMELTTCVGSLISESQIPNDNRDHLFINEMEMTECVGQMLQNNSNFSNNNDMEMTESVGQILVNNQTENNSHSTNDMEMTENVGDILKNREDLMEMTECVGGIIGQICQSNDLQRAKFPGTIDDLIDDEINSLLSNDKPIVENETTVQKYVNSDIHDANNEGVIKNEIGYSNVGFNDTSIHSFGEINSNQTADSSLTNNSYEIPSFLFDDEISFTITSPLQKIEIIPISSSKNDSLINSNAALLTTKPLSSSFSENLRNFKKHDTSAAENDSPVRAVDFYQFLPKEDQNYANIVPLRASDFDSKPKASIKEFFERIDVRFLDNLKSKARRETISKHRESEILTVPQQLFLKYGSLIELETFESVCSALNKMIEEKRIFISNQELHFNQNPPPIVELIETEHEKTNNFLKILKSNVRVWAKKDWRKFKLQFSQYLLERLNYSLSNLDSFSCQMQKSLEGIQKECSSLQLYHNELQEKYNSFSEKEKAIENLDLERLHFITEEIESLKSSLSFKEAQLSGLEEQRNSLAEEMTKENKKSSSLQLCIQQSKQLLEQHKIINQKEIEQEVLKLNFLAKLYGFVLTKVTSSQLNFQLDGKFHILLSLTVNETAPSNEKTFISRISCENSIHDVDCLLLENLLIRKVFKAEHDSPLYATFFKINLYCQRFLKLYHKIIQNLRCRYIVECDQERGCFVVVKRNGERIVLFFDDGLQKMANLNKLTE